MPSDRSSNNFLRFLWLEEEGCLAEQVKKFLGSIIINGIVEILLLRLLVEELDFDLGFDNKKKELDANLTLSNIGFFCVH